MAGSPSLTLAMKLAARAREATVQGFHYDAAVLYKQALLVLCNPQLVAVSHEAESPDVACMPQDAEPVLHENLDPNPAAVANVDARREESA